MKIILKPKFLRIEQDVECKKVEHTYSALRILQSEFEMKGGEKRMKHLRIFLVFGLAAFVIVTLAFLSNTWATEDVRNSKHNLGAGRTVDNYVQSTTTEVCVFCHTPHGSNTSVAGPAAPIWNRDMSKMTKSADFIAYTSPNFDALGDTPGKPKGVSLACLSCHDGSLAFDALLNFPGSGSVNNIGLTLNTKRVDAAGKMKNDAGNDFPMLGTDLSNDHPISMKIPCGQDPQFDNAVSLVAEKQICNNLDTGELSAGRVSPLYRGASSGVLPQDKRDRIRAYPTVGSDPYIECASCHNPHENTSTRFLRAPSWDKNDPYYKTVDAAAVNERTGATGVDASRNAGSLLCLSCHQK